MDTVYIETSIVSHATARSRHDIEVGEALPLNLASKGPGT